MTLIISQIVDLIEVFIRKRKKDTEIGEQLICAENKIKFVTYFSSVLVFG